ncbi:MAG: NAD-dependent deacylase [Candidatus Aminicenantes bacterium]|jgi:NAD-dependent deacetylase
MEESYKAIAADIRRAKRAVAFTGAGISSESGIPTYRGTGGLWSKYDPDRYANIHYFKKDPSYYWSFFRDVRYPTLKEVLPNKAHLALAEMERMGYMQTVITQNIDGLHQAAGSSSVIELHGTTRIITCMNCSEEYPMEDVYPILEEEIPPLCRECQGVLRPSVIFFGESLKPGVIGRAYEESDGCDLFLVVGSSLVVYPAANLPVTAKGKGARLAIINTDPTPMDQMADYVLREEAGTALPKIVSRLK